MAAITASLDSSTAPGQSSLVANVSNNSGLTISLHPLPILSISEHYTRDTLANGSSCKVVGALLGTQSGREVSITNSFEVALMDGGDVDMDTEGKTNAFNIDTEFLETRREQFKQVFPTLDLIGWYTIGREPSEVDIHIQHQFTAIIEAPIFLQLSPHESETSPLRTNGEIPVRIFESALGANDDLNIGGDAITTTRGFQFIELKYTVETGEAERIAVDGAAKAGDEDGSGGSALVTSLTTQRNAVAMLHERMRVLLTYIVGVINGTAQVDHAVLRQISAIVSTLPVMTETGFQDEFLTEYSDVQLTSYLANMTKSLATLNDLTDRFNAIYQKDTTPSGRGGNPDFGGFGGRSLGANIRREGRYRR
ncbi:hypothetical protein QFC20_002253 [Naganishia adeliensis]|uniref:Uncharacterized protein n=1 Tax=Naganishia adeliensis TaxID=92952 RepID=A0ACC2WL58_9TREE|nr:hypothetical protein QFC20_002253 [Naganishia adeliensis]